ncbi:MAG: response regulator [Candidatus Omnitrophota bacterium]
MKRLNKSITILLADDDPEDRQMILEAFNENRLANNFHSVEDGEELMDYLYYRDKYVDPMNAPRPGLILLDLNMPRKSGQEALAEIKKDPELKRIPVVVLTTSKMEEDVIRSYDLGVSGFIIKPVTFSGLVEAIKSLGQYWFEIVELPHL